MSFVAAKLVLRPSHLSSSHHHHQPHEQQPLSPLCNGVSPKTHPFPTGKLSGACLCQQKEGGQFFGHLLRQQHSRFDNAQFAALMWIALWVYEARHQESHQLFLSKAAPSFMLPKTPCIQDVQFLAMVIEGFVCLSTASFWQPLTCFL